MTLPVRIRRGKVAMHLAGPLECRKVPASKHSKGEQGIIQIPLAQHLATVVIASSSTPTHAASADCTAEQ
jgi:hypothetical protein